jgi:hypothetical protein
MNFLTYYKTLDDEHRCLFADNHYETLKYLPANNEVHHYEVFKGYTATDEGLASFKADFLKWSDEIRHNDVLDIDYLKYYCHYSAVEMTFKRLCKGKYEHFEDIDQVESSWIEKTHNGGLTFCEPGTYQCYSYDFSSFYPTNMSDFNFVIPYTKGQEMQLKKLPVDIELGFYRVKITSNHKHATKLFAFSKHDVYTSISLKHALDLVDDYNFKIDLIVDGKPNAYVYKKSMRASKVFGVWYNKLMMIKKLFPKNKLVKHLLSSLWGSLVHSNNVMKTYEEIQAEGLKVGIGDTADYKIVDYIWTNTKEYYKLQCMSKPYRTNFRLKSFLTAYGRVKIADVAMENLDEVKRIHTDGITFGIPMKFDIKGLIPEEKTTGLIKFEHVNKYSLIPVDERG